MRAFLAIKYYNDNKNKELIESITKTLEKININTFVFVRDIENYIETNINPKELMQRAFEEIKKSDIFIIEASETSIGIGIEACYAYMNDIPIYLIANKKSEVSSSIKGISEKIIIYEKIEDILKLQN